MDIKATLLTVLALFIGIVTGFAAGWEFDQAGPQELNQAREELRTARRDAGSARRDADRMIELNVERRDELREVKEALAPYETPDGWLEDSVKAMQKRMEDAWNDHVVRASIIKGIDRWLREGGRTGLAERTAAELGMTAEQYQAMLAALSDRG